VAVGSNCSADTFADPWLRKTIPPRALLSGGVNLNLPYKAPLDARGRPTPPSVPLPVSLTVRLGRHRRSVPSGGD